MKKKIANALELLLLAGSFMVLNTATILVTDPTVETFTPGHMKPLALMPHYPIGYYALMFLSVVCAVMCVVSIIVKSEHRDGKMHGIVPVLWCLVIHYNVISLSGQVGRWEIIGNDFPFAVFEICVLGVVILGFAKRSTIITGIPKTAEVKYESTKADELKKYKNLLDSGAITQEEYDAKKKELLGL